MTTPRPDQSKRRRRPASCPVRISAAAALLVDRLRNQTGASAPQIVDRLIILGLEVEMKRLQTLPPDDRGARALLDAYRKFFGVRFMTPL